MAIAAAITSEVLEAYLRCPYKAYFLQLGHSGAKTDYETALSELREELRRKAIRKIESRHPGAAVQHRQILTHSTLAAGHGVIFGARLEADGYSVP